MRQYPSRSHPLIEERAKAIYAERLPPANVKKPIWVEGGNSTVQDECRNDAFKQLTLEKVDLAQAFWPLEAKVDDRLIVARVDGMSLAFRISQTYDADPLDLRAEFEGFLKWDGCFNFSAGTYIMAHICRVDDFDGIKAAFAAVEDLAREHLASYYPG